MNIIVEFQVESPVHDLMDTVLFSYLFRLNRGNKI